MTPRNTVVLALGSNLGDRLARASTTVFRGVRSGSAGW